MPVERGFLELSVTVGNASFSASGETQVVFEAYADFKEYAKAVPDSAPIREHRDEPDKPSGSDADKLPDSPKRTTDLPLKPFLEQYKLRGNKEKATAILAWSAEKGEQTALTASEVEKLWRKTPFRPPGNLSRDLRAAETEGWLDSDGKPGSADAKFGINGYGEGVLASWVKDEKD